MNPKPKPPLPGGEHVQFIDTGPQGVSPSATRVNLIPVGDGGPGPLLPSVRPKKRKPLLPSAAEIAKLPRLARVAFAARCAARAGLSEAAPSDPDGVRELEVRAAAVVLATATDPRDLTRIRRDFDRIRWHARKHAWTDDTPVPPDVFPAPRRS